MDKNTLPTYARKLFYPDPALRAYISSYCILRPSIHTLPTVPWHIMPDGAAHIIFHVYDTADITNSSSRLAFVGPRSQHVFIDRKRRLLSFIARLKPGAIFLPIPFSEMRDRGMVLADLLSLNLSSAQAEMTYLARTNQIVALVKRFDQLLLGLHTSCIPQNDLILAAVETIGNTRGQISMRVLSSELGVSDRHIRSVFNKVVGLSPKRYARIVRLTETIRAAEQGYVYGWSQLAMSSGYYDQSHMIEEFHALVGESTDAFISRTNREEISMPASEFSNTSLSGNDTFLYYPQINVLES